MINETTLFIFAIACYVIAFVSYSISMSFDRDKAYNFARITMYAGITAAVIALGIRWNAAGHPPLSNMYESLATMSTLIAIVTMLFTRKRSLVLAEIAVCVGAILMIGLASVFKTDVRPLIPALQSYWLHLHVSLAFVGESFYALAFVLSYLYCFRVLLDPAEKEKLSKKEKLLSLVVVFGLPISFILGMASLAIHLKSSPRFHNDWSLIMWAVITPSCLAMIVLSIFTFRYRHFLGDKTKKWLPDLDTLDKLTYRAIAMGYPLFTVGGLIFGMVWANKAWGRYWGWDPKETWALITFFVYSAYLHVRLTRGWKGVWTASISMLGFLVTMFTLFGVNMLIRSLHSYAGI